MPKTFLRDVTTNVVGGVISGVLLLIVGAYYYGSSTERQKYEKVLNDAPTVYVEHLHKKIKQPVSGNAGEILLKAKDIVSTRNDLRSTLTAMTALLNSEIDHLSAQLDAADAKRLRGDYWNSGEIEEALKVLERKWIVKPDQVKFEVRKLLGDLGLTRRE
jgi:hypothetical protein